MEQKVTMKFVLIKAKYFAPFLFLACLYLMFDAPRLDPWKHMLHTKRVGLITCRAEKHSDGDLLVYPRFSLMHNMSDDELLFIASFYPPGNRRHQEIALKVAFMFLTNGPLHLAPLWEMFFEGNEGLFSIYIHSPPGYKANFSTNSVFYKRQIRSQAAEWGRMNICDAERRLLANALLDTRNERFVLLSESCIPLHHFRTVHNYLIGSPLSYVAVLDDHGPHGRGRYNSFMEPLIGIDQWRKGSQWVEVHRDVALYIVRDTKYYSKFNEFCKPPCYPDEHYFPSMLHIEKPGLIARKSITFVDWSRGGCHPATFGRDDISDEFFAKMLCGGGRSCVCGNNRTTIGFLFARKFAPSSLEPLMRLAPTMLGFGGNKASSSWDI